MKPYKRMTTTLTAFEAAERVLELRATAPELEREVLAALTRRLSDDELHIRSRVPEDQRHRVDILVTAMAEADREAKALVESRNGSAMTGPDRDSGGLSANLTRDVPPIPPGGIIETEPRAKAGRR